jgi:hypothetical protein
MQKRVFQFGLLLVWAASLLPQKSRGGDYYIRLINSCTSQEKNQLLSELVRLPKTRIDSSLHKTRFMNLKDWYRIEADGSDEVVLAVMRNSSLVKTIDPIPKYRFSQPPNDSLFLLGQQWSLNKIKATQAWEFSQGDTSIVVAVADDAVDILHPDLRSNIFTNHQEIPGDGLDNDANGFVDDYQGYDVSTSSPSVLPPDSTWSHGTAVAGIMAGATNNERGISSMLWNTRLLPVKISSNGIYVTHGVEGIAYSIDMGARVLNLSWGSSDNSLLLKQIIDTAVLRKQVVVVCAAGNNNSDVPIYPAAYNRANGISSSTQTDLKSLFSNFGDWVDLAAPGEGIATTLPGGRYGFVSGTSFSAPLVSGVAALMLSMKPDLLPYEVTTCLREVTDYTYLGAQQCGCSFGSGRLNAFRSLQCVSFMLGLPKASEEAPMHRIWFSEGLLWVTSTSAASVKMEGYTSLGQSFLPQQEVHLQTGMQSFPVAFGEAGIYFIRLLKADGSSFTQPVFLHP